MTKQRRSYTKEFKREAVNLVVEHGYTQAEAARSLGVRANLIGRWQRESEAQGEHAFRGNGKLPADRERIRELEAQVRRLNLEKEVLKKAAVFFAKESS
ncbi:MAG: transposase [Gammaproteobacteria bacterium]|nr:transposase [Gammaproteobacteria bacterium]MDH3464742.1 transposase [Gammaproteobacteria bacterium]